MRQWATSARADETGCPRHVAEALLELAAGTSARRPAPASASPASASPASGFTLMVVGLPTRQLERASATFRYWAGLGRRWVGDPARWRMVAVDVASPHLPLLAAQQPRWALWVDSDPDAFRRAWRLLVRLAERQGPRRLLAVHPTGMGRHGLLDNLRQAAWAYLGIDLVVLA
ncbi:hypothetical protein C1H70_07310 [Halomonas urumqiensis]|uniref:Uncharacterized protein n=1 Tax=Halomonas urumqiensis TaxID=1684789 RepID=A0A2N7UKJ4_9GAMM|nr:hypothetical protein C1H70_07310 [Halomonas urumqiensis]PTB02941.1 hypothetical protein C6V82_09310 [Halomonas urumqiensis]